MNRYVMSLWTVYDHPSDYPRVFVARRFAIYRDGATEATRDIKTADTIEKLRYSLMRLGLICLTRSPEDDAKIMETWL